MTNCSISMVFTPSSPKFRTRPSSKKALNGWRSNRWGLKCACHQTRPPDQPMKVLIVPDKFKGTLTAFAASEAIARGWNRVRPKDSLELLPMSDGGDGFGEIISRLLQAEIQEVKTVDAAHRPLMAHWWWAPKSKLAIIESARVIGLALLPSAKYHPFELD